MHFLIEIVHPADVLFFIRPMRMLQEAGHRTTVVSRHKDVACALLDRFEIDHIPISTKGDGVVGLGMELLRRNLALWRIVRRDRPDLMLGFGGVSVSQVGWLTGVPSLIVYDSEYATLQTRLAWPFLTRLIVPGDYTGKTPVGRTEYLPGTKDFSYFHPSAFTPDLDVAKSLGFDPERRNIFMRLVKWGANHDIGKTGLSEDQLGQLVARLAPLGKLHVSAETDAPDIVAPYLFRGDPQLIHHLMGHCDLYVGESATMACEAVALGLPAIYAGVDFWGYVAGLARRDLITCVQPGDRDTLADIAEARLLDHSAFASARKRWLGEVPDWAEVVVRRAVELAGQAASER
ncbi:DUF354 domain-containing protein [Roseovarius sp. PS-C2]|uniref:DUF354 domain-containing protein n=1 Tax=Roseovarius sp. PS-C2 TaxID=2820814 RepID=UPI001C0E4B65|nr:DUF354 domain-containing protein [Roseovarius sp. PS-C2]MBU3261075.1 DUF354 domain-containing protein [Roseovarius sp. PS-C2]